MTLKPKSRISDAAAFVLQGNNKEVLVRESVRLVSLTESALDANTNRLSLRIEGEILGREAGVDLTASRSSHVVIGQRGLVQGGLGGIGLGQGENTLINRGVILGGSLGIVIEDPSQTRIVNDGLIACQGSDPAELGVAVLAGGGTDLDMLNRGRIFSLETAILATEGDDRLVNQGRITGDVFLGDGNDTIDNRAGIIVGDINMGEGDNVFRPGASAEIVANDGRLTVIFGGKGAVKVFLDNSGTNTGRAKGDAYEAVAKLIGSEADDVIVDGGGSERLEGGKGNDKIEGGENLDTLLGGAGNDTLSQLQGSGADQMFGGDGRDLIEGAGGAESLFGGAGKDSLSGNENQDQLFGGDGNDSLSGGDDQDQLFGGKGQDSLFGGQDQDTLNGGAGVDMLRGDLGNDVFVFASLAEAGDIIADFRQAIGNFDRIQIKASGFGGDLALGQLEESRFLASTNNRAGDADDRFILRESDKTLWFDRDGTGTRFKSVLVADLQDDAILNAGLIDII